MPFFLLMVYQCLFLLRPFEWGANNDGTRLPLAVLCLIGSATLMFIQRLPLYFSPQIKLSFGICVVILFSAVSNRWLGAAPGQLQIFILIAIIPMLLYSNLVNSNEKQETVMLLFLIAAMVALSNGLTQLASADGIGWAGSKISQGTRITYLGILEDPNDLGGYFVICFPFAAYLATYSPKLIIRVFSKFTFLALLYGIFLTNSRGALLATLAIFGAYSLYRFGKGKTFFLGALSLPVLVVIISMFRTIDSQEDSASGRVDAWYEGFQMLASSPIFGVGLGNFLDYHHLTAHNSFILIMSELGTVGYAFWFSMMGLSFFMLLTLLRHFQKLQSENNFKLEITTELNRALAINSALFFSLFGYAITAFFLSRSYHFLTYFLCAIAVASYQQITAHDSTLKMDLSYEVKRLLILSVLSIIGLNFVVKVLL